MKKFLAIFVCLLVAGMMTVTAEADCCWCNGTCVYWGGCDEPLCECICEDCSHHACICAQLVFVTDYGFELNDGNVISFGTVLTSEIADLPPVELTVINTGELSTNYTAYISHCENVIFTIKSGIYSCCCSLYIPPGFAPGDTATFYIAPYAGLEPGLQGGWIDISWYGDDYLRRPYVSFRMWVVNCTDGSTKINLATVEHLTGGPGWSFRHSTLSVYDGANITVTTEGEPAPNQRRISSEFESATVTLYNAVITATNPISVNLHSVLNLYIEGENTLNGGIRLMETNAVIIGGTGKLIANGTNNNAGIGGGRFSVGDTTILGDVTVIARGGTNSAGIGGGGVIAPVGIPGASGVIRIEENATVRAYSGAGHANTVAIGAGVNAMGVSGVLTAPVYIAPTATVFLDGICAACGYYPCDCDDFGINPPTGVRGITALMWAMFASLAASAALWMKYRNMYGGGEIPRKVVTPAL